MAVRLKEAIGGSHVCQKATSFEEEGDKKRRHGQHELCDKENDVTLNLDLWIQFSGWTHTEHGTEAHFPGTSGGKYVRLIPSEQQVFPRCSTQQRVGSTAQGYEKTMQGEQRKIMNNQIYLLAEYYCRKHTNEDLLRLAERFQRRQDHTV